MKRKLEDLEILEESVSSPNSIKKMPETSEPSSSFDVEKQQTSYAEREITAILQQHERLWSLNLEIDSEILCAAVTPANLKPDKRMENHTHCAVVRMNILVIKCNGDEVVLATAAREWYCFSGRLYAAYRVPLNAYVELIEKKEQLLITFHLESRASTCSILRIRKSDYSGRPLYMTIKDSHIFPINTVSLKADNGEVLRGSKELLGYHSQVFSASLLGTYSEATKSEIPMVAVEVDVLKDFMEFIYNKKFPRDTKARMAYLMDLATERFAPMIYRYCFKYLMYMRQPADVDELAQLIVRCGRTNDVKVIKFLLFHYSNTDGNAQRKKKGDESPLRKRFCNALQLAYATMDPSATMTIMQYTWNLPAALTSEDRKIKGNIESVAYEFLPYVIILKTTKDTMAFELLTNHQPDIVQRFISSTMMFRQDTTSDVEIKYESRPWWTDDLINKEVPTSRYLDPALSLRAKLDRKYLYTLNGSNFLVGIPDFTYDEDENTPVVFGRRLNEEEEREHLEKIDEYPLKMEHNGFMYIWKTNDDFYFLPLVDT